MGACLGVGRVAQVAGQRKPEKNTRIVVEKKTGIGLPLANNLSRKKMFFLKRIDLLMREKQRKDLMAESGGNVVFPPQVFTTDLCMGTSFRR